MSVKRVAVIGLGAMGADRPPIAGHWMPDHRLESLAAAGGGVGGGRALGRAHQDYSAVLAHILHTATKGLQR
jgi:hypothetical protein